MNRIVPALCLALAHLVPGALLAQPVLQIVPGGPNVEIRWTHQPPGWRLETTASLNPPIAWQPAAESPTANGDQRSVTLSPAAATRFFRLRQAGLTTVNDTSPSEGEAGVSVNRETILRFSGPLAANTTLLNTAFYAEFGARRLLTRVELAADRRSATLFYLEPLPGGAGIRVTFDSTGLQDAAGQGVDADGDGAAGGQRVLSFETAPTAEVPATRVIGHVYDSEPVPLPGGGFTNRPLAGVTVTVDGAEQTLRAQTDENGFFSLRSPAGQFFVHVAAAPRGKASGRTGTTTRLSARPSPPCPAVPTTWPAARAKSSCPGSGPARCVRSAPPRPPLSPSRQRCWPSIPIWPA